MKRVLMLVLLAAMPVLAQEKKAEEPPQPPVQKLFILKYADPRTVADLLRVFSVPIFPNTEMHALAVTAPQRTMPAIEDAIARLDTPAAAAKNVDLTFYFIVGSDADGAGGALPKDLDSVVTQLKNTFPFKNYRLMDVLTTRTRTGMRVELTSTGGSIAGSAEQQPVITNLNINSVSIGADGATIRVDGLKAGSRVPIPTGNGFNYMNLGINTDVDMKEGQKVVVGRVGMTKDQALFLVIMAKVVS